MIIIFNFLEWYKEKKRRKYKNKIQKHINFNTYRINEYKLYPNKPENIIRKYEDDWAICACYSIETLNEFHNKYNVSQKLINKLLATEKECLLEYDNMENRIEKEKGLSEEREKIRLYKKAILELKNEGKI